MRQNCMFLATFGVDCPLSPVPYFIQICQYFWRWNM